MYNLPSNPTVYYLCNYSSDNQYGVQYPTVNY